MNSFTVALWCIVMLVCYFVELTTAKPGMMGGMMGGKGGHHGGGNHMDLIVAGIVAKLLQSH